MECDSLAGRRILVTRAAHQAGKLSDALRRLGVTPVEVPVLEIQPPENPAAFQEAIRELDSYDWVILTSTNTVANLGAQAAALNVPFNKMAPLHVAAVGEATAQAARLIGLPVQLVPEKYVAESLVEALLISDNASKRRTFSQAQNPPQQEGALQDAEELHRSGPCNNGTALAGPLENSMTDGALAPEGTLSGQRILLARAAVARDVIPDALRAAGATVDVVDAYRNVMPANAPALLRSALEQGIDAATFTSSSSITHLADAAKAANIVFPFAGIAAISIGPITSQTLREHGWEPAVEASPSDIPGLVEAIRRFFISI